jgi:LURP-one-related
MSQLATVGPQGLAANPFSFNTYTITRKFFTFLGRDFQVLDPSGNLCMYVRHKMLTLKDEWNIATDESMSVPLVRVKAREAIAVNITTDVFDAGSGAVVGTVRSKGLKSILSDTWEVLDQAGNVVGELKEDSNGFLRRLLPTFFTMPLILGRWHLSVNGETVMAIHEQRTFFVKTFTTTITSSGVDRRFALGCALLALMKEITREQRNSD